MEIKIEVTKQNPIMELTFSFALNIITYVERLESKHKYVIARQLLKSGTSIGANIREAQNAESKLDFIHKFKIAAKEADETEYWLMLCEQSNSYENPDNLIQELITIKKIISKIIASSKKSLSQKN